MASFGSNWIPWHQKQQALASFVCIFNFSISSYTLKIHHPCCSGRCLFRDGCFVCWVQSVLGSASCFYCSRQLLKSILWKFLVPWNCFIFKAITASVCKSNFPTKKKKRRRKDKRISLNPEEVFWEETLAALWLCILNGASPVIWITLAQAEHPQWTLST